MFKYTVYIFFIFYVSASAYAQSTTIKNPLKSFIKDINLDTSISPVIHRVLNDFNGDGLTDMALSYSGDWGNKGGTFYFYFKNRDNTYRHFDKLDIHPLSYGIVNRKGKIIQIKVCHNLSGGYANFCTYAITSKGFKLKKCKSVGQYSGEVLAELIGKQLIGTKAGIWQFAKLKCLKNNQKCWMSSKYNKRIPSSAQED